MMIDGRIAILTEKPKHIPEPVEITTHPLRDVWLLWGDKWDRTKEAVAWEDLVASTYPISSGVDACLCIYRKSSSDLRRHAEAEATLHRESSALRHATDDYHYSPKGTEGDSSLILSAPHSMQPVVLEDNQATIRILASGKSPAFRHADKTQRINLGWLSEQFRRKHCDLAYISTSLQAADILTRPFTNADKWKHVVRLLGHGIVKPDSRSAAAPSTPASTSDARRRTEPEVKRVIIEICCSEDSLLGRVDGLMVPTAMLLGLLKDWTLIRTRPEETFSTSPRAMLNRGCPSLCGSAFHAPVDQHGRSSTLPFHRTPRRCTKRKESSSSYGPRLSIYQLALTVAKSIMPLNGPEVVPTRI